MASRSRSAGAQPMAHDIANEAVQGDGVIVAAHQGQAAQHDQRVFVGQGVAAGHQFEGDVVGRQKSGGAQHPGGGGALCEGSFVGQAEGGGHGAAVERGRAPLQHLPPPGHHQLPVGAQGHGRLLHVGPGLLQGQGQEAHSVATARAAASSSVPVRASRKATASDSDHTSMSRVEPNARQLGLREVTSTPPPPPAGGRKGPREAGSSALSKTTSQRCRCPSSAWIRLTTTSGSSVGRPRWWARGVRVPAMAAGTSAGTHHTRS